MKISNKNSIAIILVIGVVCFLFYQPAFSQAFELPTKVLVLKNAGEKKYDLYFYPYQGNLFTFSMTNYKEDFVRIDGVEKQVYKDFLEHNIKIFSNYLHVDTAINPGQKYYKLIELMHLIGPMEIILRDMKYIYIDDPTVKVNLEYLKNAVKPQETKIQAENKSNADLVDNISTPNPFPSLLKWILFLILFVVILQLVLFAFVTFGEGLTRGSRPHGKVAGVVSSNNDDVNSEIDKINNNLKFVYEKIAQSIDNLEKVFYVNAAARKETFFHLILDKLDKVNVGNNQNSELSEQLDEIRKELITIQKQSDANRDSPDVSPDSETW